MSVQFSNPNDTITLPRELLKFIMNDVAMVNLANAGSKYYEREFGFRFSTRARVAVAWHLEQQEIAGMVESKENNEPCDKCPDVDNGYTGPGISFFGLDPKTGGTTMTYCTCETGKLRRAYWDIMSNRA